VKRWWFRLRYGTWPHTHKWERVAAMTWACAYEEYAGVIDGDPPLRTVRRCSAWHGLDCWG
jgi:hypothetical protein